MIEIERERFVHLITKGAELQAYDDMPIVPERMDPQLYLSRNDRPQPFFLLCQRDTVVATVTGSGSIAFGAGAVRSVDTEPGTHVYVPAGTPHRIVPNEVQVQLRYKAADAGLEGVVWFCQACDAELWRYEFDTAMELSQAGWSAGVAAFNGDPRLRVCSCGAVHPEVMVDGIRWPEIAEALAAERDEAVG